MLRRNNLLGKFIGAGFMQKTALHLLACLTALHISASQAQEVRIGFVFDKTGPLEAYFKQTQAGFQMGLDYATGGTMVVAGRKLRVIERDSKGKPDVAKAQLAAAYADDKVALAVGSGASGVTLAMLPVAEDYRKIGPGVIVRRMRSRTRWFTTKSAPASALSRRTTPSVGTGSTPSEPR